jgi:hypothetical protein
MPQVHKPLHLKLALKRNVGSLMLCVNSSSLTQRQVFPHLKHSKHSLAYKGQTQNVLLSSASAVEKHSKPLQVKVRKHCYNEHQLLVAYVVEIYKAHWLNLDQLFFQALLTNNMSVWVELQV